MPQLLNANCTSFTASPSIPARPGGGWRLREAKIGTDKIIERLDGLLKTRTLYPITSQTTPKNENGQPGLKLVVSK